MKQTKTKLEQALSKDLKEIQAQPKYPAVPEGDEPESMYHDDSEDSEGYKEDGCAWIFCEEALVD